MELKEIKTKSIPDLHKLLREFRDHTRDLKFKASRGVLKKIGDIKSTKKDIARVLTILNSLKEKK
ncbi:MAG: 50S ribosomal protein L29 [Candidatus Falkowbacteria bacterium]|nr:50S ribosomal protein L29 [Candidatus Falkowbacteria bacterium]